MVCTLQYVVLDEKSSDTPGINGDEMLLCPLCHYICKIRLISTTVLVEDTIWASDGFLHLTVHYILHRNLVELMSGKQSLIGKLSVLS